jgi:type III secretion system low calcium response chaperone LcrH/SycD
MNRLQYLVHEVIQNLDAKIKPEERQKLEEAMMKIVVEGQTPKDVLGFSDEMMEHMYNYGYRLYNNGNYKKASDVFRALTTYNPKENRYFLALGAALHRQKNNKEACEAYLVAAILDPKDPLPFYYMFDCYNQVGMLSDAQGCLQEAIRRMGDNPVFNKLKPRCELLLEGLLNHIKELEKEGKLLFEEPKEQLTAQETKKS